MLLSFGYSTLAVTAHVASESFLSPSRLNLFILHYKMSLLHLLLITVSMELCDIITLVNKI